MVSSQLFLSVDHRNWVNIYLRWEMNTKHWRWFCLIRQLNLRFANNFIREKQNRVAILRKQIDWETFANVHWPRSMMHHWTDCVRWTSRIEILKRCLFYRKILFPTKTDFVASQIRSFSQIHDFMNNIIFWIYFFVGAVHVSHDYVIDSHKTFHTVHLTTVWNVYICCVTDKNQWNVN